jgi:hypothetical protein
MGDDLTVIVETGEGNVTGRPVLYEQVVLEIMRRLVFCRCSIQISAGTPTVMTDFLWFSSVPPCKCRNNAPIRS